MSTASFAKELVPYAISITQYYNDHRILLNPTNTILKKKENKTKKKERNKIISSVVVVVLQKTTPVQSVTLYSLLNVIFL